LNEKYTPVRPTPRLKVPNGKEHAPAVVEASFEQGCVSTRSFAPAARTFGANGIDRQRGLVLRVARMLARRACHADQGTRARCRGRRARSTGRRQTRRQCPHHAARRSDYQEPPLSHLFIESPSQVCRSFAAIVKEANGDAEPRQATIEDEEPREAETTGSTILPRILLVRVKEQSYNGSLNAQAALSRCRA
jgi:hypothetical protein